MSRPLATAVRSSKIVKEPLRKTTSTPTLEIRFLLAYIPGMAAAVNKTPPNWIVESLERSEAQIAAGQTVPLEPVLDRLRASMARMKSKPTPKPVRKA